MPPHDFTIERLKELLTYDPETGVFRNRTFRSSVAKPGDIAGCRHNMGYWKIRLDRHYMLGHRLAWFYVHGVWAEEIDHINRDRGDNRIANLRPVTHSQNMMNKHRTKKSATGFPGVSKHRSQFHAAIKSGGKKRHLGSFKTAEEAHAAYCLAAAETFGEYGNPTDWRKAA